MKLVALSSCAVATAMRVNTGKVVTDNQDAPSCYWPLELTAEGYTGEHEVGAGATACVFIANNPSGQPPHVAVKSSKLPGTLSFWRHECAAMEELRVQACHTGRHEFELSQMYLPTCVSVAGDDQHAWYVMHAAGTNDMETIRTRGLNRHDEKKVFAEMLGAVGLLHSLGHTHNDLHGHNIVLDHTELALIDYGSMRPIARAKRDGYKRDGNAIWRWTGEIAQCPPEALWQMGDPTAMATAKPFFLQCIQSRWSPGQAFMSALEAVADADIAQSIEQHVVALFETDFVQQHMPAFRAIYPWHETDGCLNWDNVHWNQESDAITALEADFTGMTVYQCESIPTFDDSAGTTCRFTPQNPACFSTHAGIYWSCMPAATFLGDCTQTADTGGQGFYMGGCIMRDHVNYAQAIRFDASTFVEPRMALSQVTIGAQRPYRCESIPTWDGESGVTCRLNMNKAACFSLTAGFNWVCAGSDGLNSFCSSIPMPDSRETYDGACLMEGHANWDSSVAYDRHVFVKEVPVHVGGCRRRRCSN